MRQSYFEDVRACYVKFGFIPVNPLPPAPLRPDVIYLRMGHMVEELAEFAESQGAVLAAAELRKVSKGLLEFVPEMAVAPDMPPIAGLADGGDALLDLAFLALGTGALMHLPMDPMWDEVVRANMERERVPSAGDSKRGHSLDLRKPPGWRGPDHWPLIYERATKVETVTYSVSVTDEEMARLRPRLCFCVTEDAGHVRGADGCLHGPNPPRCSCDASCGENRSHVYGSAGCSYAVS